MTIRRLQSIAATTLRVAIGAVLLFSAACSSDSPTEPAVNVPYSQTDLVVGTGAEAVNGSRATVSYAGWLYDASRPDNKGAQFDASAGYTFTVGIGTVIKGWDQGVPGMRVGGQRRLVLPPSLAYGSQGAGVIPPNSTLVFDITLLGVQ